MDDPWGSSPWADDQFEPAPSNANKPIAQETTHTQNKSTISPWGEDGDDEFGDWAALPVEDNIKNGESIIRSPEAWGHNEGNSRQDDAIPADELQSAWFHRDVKERGDSASLHPGATSTQQPSPDPWRTEFIPESHNFEAQIVLKDAPDLNLSLGDEPSLQNVIDGQNASEKELPKLEAVSPSAISNTTEGEASSEHTVVAPSRIDPSDPNSPVTRPSTSPSDISHSGERPESPRTSFEDELKRPPLQRNQSSKVKELVEHFDNLVAAKVETLNEHGKRFNEEEGTKIMYENEEDGDDFGDFAEGCQDETEDDSMAVFNDEIPQSDAIVEKQIPTETTPPSDAQGDAQAAIKPASFSIDIDLIQNLTASDTEFFEVAEPMPDKELPVDPTAQEFGSDEHRKIWYRISRYGTLRKHDSGDYENYARITWPTSSTRDETLKIVARWMEEDRIGRGITLGGANKLGSLFGWRESSGLLGGALFDTKSRATDKPKMSALPSPKAIRTSPSRKLSKEDSRQAPVDGRVSSPITIIREPTTTTTQFGWSSSHSVSESKSTAQKSQSIILGSSILPSGKVDSVSERGSRPPLAEAFPHMIPQPRPISIYDTKGQDALHQASQQAPPATISLNPHTTMNQRTPEIPSQGFVTSNSPKTQSASLWDFGVATQLPGSFQAAVTPSHSTIPAVQSLQETRSQSDAQSLDEFFGFRESDLTPRGTQLGNEKSSRPTLTLRTATVPDMIAPVDDEDEWGEMVSSPVRGLAPPPRTPSPARKQRPQSLMNPLTSNNLEALFGASRGHRPSFSQEIATPEKVESIMGSPALHSPIKRTPRTSVSSVRSMNSAKADPWSIDNLSMLDGPPPKRMSSTASSRPRRPSRLSVSATSAPTIAAPSAHLPTIISPPPPDAMATFSPISRTDPVIQVPQNTNLKSREELEQDKIVKGIIQGLPDLSYMLRR